MDRVTSRQNALVKRFRALAQQRSPDDSSVLLDGAHLLEEALKSDVPIDTAVFSDTAADGPLASLALDLERRGGRVVAIPDALLASVSPVQHPSGVVAIAQLEPATLDTLLTRRPALLLLLDGVQDPGNLGAIIRVAEACGATGIVVGAGSADPFGWKALRGAMGSSLRLPIVPRASLDEVVDRLRAERIHVFATVPRDGTPLSECELHTPAALLLGGEGAGLSADLVRAANARLTIPMSAPVESLNVAIAAALVLYEASRQRAHVAVR